MKNFIDPFLYNAPHLDIHGYDRYGATAMIKNFIDNYIHFLIVFFIDFAIKEAFVIFLTGCITLIIGLIYFHE